MSWSTSELWVRLALWNQFKRSSKSNLLTVQKAVLLLSISCVSYTSCWRVLCSRVPCSYVVTCWKRADLLALVFVVFYTFPNVSWSTSEFRVRLAPWNWFKPSSKIFYWPFQGGTTYVDLLCFFLSYFCYALCACVYLCLVVTCWERTDLLALVCGV